MELQKYTQIVKLLCQLTAELRRGHKTSYQLGAVHKLRHIFSDHFRHPPPPCHNVIF